MKSKGEKIALIVAIIIIITVIAVGITSVVLGIKFIKKNLKLAKEAITPDKFVALMNDEGFEVKDITDSIEANAKKIYKADNGKYSIKYYSFENVSEADNFYESVEKELTPKTATKEVSMSGKNYRTYTVVKSGAYTFIERVDNTVVIVQGSSSHENTSKDLLKKFGY